MANILADAQHRLIKTKLVDLSDAAFAKMKNYHSDVHDSKSQRNSKYLFILVFSRSVGGSQDLGKLTENGQFSNVMGFVQEKIRNLWKFYVFSCFFHFTQRDL